MARKFETKITRARYTVSGLRAGDMQELGKDLLLDIKKRINIPQDVHDRAALPLKANTNYARYKARRFGRAVRDLMNTGYLQRGMHVLRVDQNQAVLGFADPAAEQRMVYNQRRNRQWGVSPANIAYIVGRVRQRLTVQAVKVTIAA